MAGKLHQNILKNTAVTRFTTNYLLYIDILLPHSRQRVIIFCLISAYFLWNIQCWNLKHLPLDESNLEFLFVNDWCKVKFIVSFLENILTLSWGNCFCRSHGFNCVKITIQFIWEIFWEILFCVCSCFDVNIYVPFLTRKMNLQTLPIRTLQSFC